MERNKSKSWGEPEIYKNITFNNRTKTKCVKKQIKKVSKYGCNMGSSRGGGGGGGGEHYGTEPERRLVSFIYFIVESKFAYYQ